MPREKAEAKLERFNPKTDPRLVRDTRGRPLMGPSGGIDSIYYVKTKKELQAVQHLIANSGISDTGVQLLPGPSGPEPVSQRPQSHSLLGSLFRALNARTTQQIGHLHNDNGKWTAIEPGKSPLPPVQQDPTLGQRLLASGGWGTGLTGRGHGQSELQPSFGTSAQNALRDPEQTRIEAGGAQPAPLRALIDRLNRYVGREPGSPQEQRPDHNQPDMSEQNEPGSQMGPATSSSWADLLPQTAIDAGETELDLPIDQPDQPTRPRAAQAQEPKPLDPGSQSGDPKISQPGPTQIDGSSGAKEVTGTSGPQTSLDPIGDTRITDLTEGTASSLLPTKPSTNILPTPGPKV